MTQNNLPLAPRPLAFSSHNHAKCSTEALDYAEKSARKSNLRLTPVRRRTLEILLESHKALGAYEVLERLAADGFGAQPPVAYRALDFLVEHGFAHRVRRLNAFTACMHSDSAHRPVFFICRACESVAEVAAPRVEQALENTATSLGFQVERLNIEALGLCPACSGGQA